MADPAQANSASVLTLNKLFFMIAPFKPFEFVALFDVSPIDLNSGTVEPFSSYR
jgi:hypothetical protein